MRFRFARSAMFNLGDTAAAHLLDLVHQSLGLIELFNVVTAPNALAHEQDVRHRSPASRFSQQSLKLLAERIDVELDHERLGYNAVFVKEDVFRFLRVWAVRFGEDDDYTKVSVCEAMRLYGTYWGSSSISRSVPSQPRGLPVFRVLLRLPALAIYLLVQRRQEPSPRLS